MGLLKSGEWKAKWIEAPGAREPFIPAPSPCMRREFTLESPVKQAVVFRMQKSQS